MKSLLEIVFWPKSWLTDLDLGWKREVLHLNKLKNTSFRRKPDEMEF